VERTFKPFTQKNIGARVSVVSNVNQAGSIVVTPVLTGSHPQESVIISASTWKGKGFNPVDSPGEGDLVPLGAGYVYQQSTITNLTSSLPTSDGPVTPSVIFGSENGTTLVVQGFQTTKKSFAPDSADTIVEPTLEQATPSAVFYPLEIPGDLPGLPGATAYPAIAYPEGTYQSPFSINLSGAPSSIYTGLLPTTPKIVKSAKGWGPSNKPSTPPSVPTGEGAGWLEERLLAAYNQTIGIAYQHHHDPFWLPTQGSEWNAVNIGYQSQGIDCTNLTAYAYWDAFGVFLNANTPMQASISPTDDSSSLITIPQSMTPYLSIQVHAGPVGDSLTDYKNFVSQLQPGDILFINPSKTPGEATDPAACTHAITWLGHFGVDANGMYPNLIVDSTGNQPAHVDSNNHEIPGGVHVRPFAAPNAEGLNMWYFEHVDHVLRLVVSS
jgi:cell wall-associated NlpC family hydrolase